MKKKFNGIDKASLPMDGTAVFFELVNGKILVGHFSTPDNHQSPFLLGSFVEAANDKTAYPVWQQPTAEAAKIPAQIAACEKVINSKKTMPAAKQVAIAELQKLRSEKADVVQMQRNHNTVTGWLMVEIPEAK